MALPAEMIQAMARCFDTCFFYKAKMEAFLKKSGVQEPILARYSGEKKFNWATMMLLELNGSGSGQLLQQRILTELCKLTDAPDHSVKDRQAAGDALDYLKNLAGRYRESLACAIFDTSDPVLDELLETARRNFLDPAIHDRREALKKLWDAWERLKTLEGGDKKTAIGILLDRVSPDPAFRNVLEAEAKALTEIGNSFMIRHTEVVGRRSTITSTSITCSTGCLP